MKRRLLGLLALALGGCHPAPQPGTQRSNGTFTFPRDDDRTALLDATAVASQGGVIFVGTHRDLRRIVGSKDAGFSEPTTVELTPGQPAEVAGVAFSADGATVYAGFTLGVAVVDAASSAVVGTVTLPAPVARLYRAGDRLLAVSFDNALTVLSLASPTQPVVVGTLQLAGGTGPVQSATVQPGRVTLSAPGAIWVVDPSATPKLLSMLAVDFGGASARGDGFLFTGNTGARAVLAMPDDQTATPSGPAETPWRLPGAAPVLAGARLFMVDAETGDVYVSDVSQPTAPALVTSLKPDVRVSCGGLVRDSALDADQVFWVACAGGLVNYVIDF